MQTVVTPWEETLSSGEHSVVYAALVFAGLALLAAVSASLPSMPREAAVSYRHALLVLVVVWFAYPIAYGMQGLAQGGARTAAMQVVLSLADVVAKVGFGMLIHKVAKLRTAEDVRGGVDPHPESVWISSRQQSAGALPPATPADGGPLRGMTGD